MKRRIALLLVVPLGAFTIACGGLPLPFGNRSAAATPTAQPRSAAPTAAVPPTPLLTAAPLPSRASAPTIGPEVTGALDAQQQILVELYRRVGPAVVSIDVSMAHPAMDDASAPGDITVSLGSGFLFDDQGHIVTNQHVIEDGGTFQVRFSDGTIVPARVIGSDVGSDLAVIKVDSLPADAAPLTLGDARAVAVGQTAIAIGNPFGLQNTMTVGIVSGIARSLEGQATQRGTFRIPNVIQTDAAINPGNSGGPLLNIRGEVVGVNTAIRSESGSFEGIGYAVPASTVGRVVPALISSGRYEHPWIGIGMRDVEPQMAERFDFAAAQGVLITEIVPGGPADRAGLRSGTQEAEFAGRPIAPDADIIIAIDGQRVLDSDALVSYIELETSGAQTVVFSVLRGGQQIDIPLVLGTRPRE